MVDLPMEQPLLVVPEWEMQALQGVANCCVALQRWCSLMERASDLPKWDARGLQRAVSALLVAAGPNGSVVHEKVVAWPVAHGHKGTNPDAKGRPALAVAQAASHLSLLHSHPVCIASFALERLPLKPAASIKRLLCMNRKTLNTYQWTQQIAVRFYTDV